MNIKKYGYTLAKIMGVMLLFQCSSLVADEAKAAEATTVVSKSDMMSSATKTVNNPEEKDYYAMAEQELMDKKEDMDDTSTSEKVHKISKALKTFIADNKPVIDEAKVTLNKYKEKCEKFYDDEFAHKDLKKEFAVDRLDTSALEEMYDIVREFDNHNAINAQSCPKVLHNVDETENYSSEYPLGYGFAMQKNAFGESGVRGVSKLTGNSFSSIIKTTVKNREAANPADSGLDFAVENVKDEIAAIKKELVAILLHKKAKS